MSDLNEVAAEIHRTAVAKGWWDDGDRNFGEMIALVHSELSEALEAWRKHDRWFYRQGDDAKPEGIGIELTDAIIRIFDILHWHGQDIDMMIREKMAYNATRPHRHGGLRA
jgi:NTP pyrophosphatase (non-canonical NTP hydrolase)